MCIMVNNITDFKSFITFPNAVITPIIKYLYFFALENT